MYKKAVNYLRGSVPVQLCSPYPERVLNLCGAHEIPFWDVRWLSPQLISLRTTRRGLREVRRVCGEAAEITVGREEGIPILWQRVKRRYVLLIGFALFCLALFGGNLFIWDFEVTGNETVSEETILRALEGYGLTIGSPGMHVDQEAIRNHVLLELPDISWLAVNVKGCTAHVQVVERLRPPEIVKEDEVCNVVARRSGLVTKVQALDGQAQVLPGDTVTEGELLISGVVDSDQNGLRLLHGQGSVRARTWYDLAVQIPLQYEKKTQSTRQRRRFAIDFGKKRVKFYGKGSVTGAGCDKIIRYHPISVMGLRLPVTWVVEETTRYEMQRTTRTVAAAQKEGEAQLLRELTAAIGAEGCVKDSQFTASKQGKYLRVMLHAECEEEIGQAVTLAVE